MRQMAQSAEGRVLTPEVASTRGHYMLPLDSDGQFVTRGVEALVSSRCGITVAALVKADIITLRSQGLGQGVFATELVFGSVCQLVPFLSFSFFLSHSLNLLPHLQHRLFPVHFSFHLSRLLLFFFCFFFSWPVSHGCHSRSCSRAKKKKAKVREGMGRGVGKRTRTKLDRWRGCWLRWCDGGTACSSKKNKKDNEWKKKLVEWMSQPCS